MLKKLHENVYVEVRTHFDPYARDDKPKFYYYIYRTSEELVFSEIEFINDRVQFFDNYNECWEEAIAKINLEV